MFDLGIILPVENQPASHHPGIWRPPPVKGVETKPARVAKVLPSPKMAPAWRGAMSRWFALTCAICKKTLPFGPGLGLGG